MSKVFFWGGVVPEGEGVCLSLFLAFSGVSDGRLKDKVLTAKAYSETHGVVAFKP